MNRRPGKQEDPVRCGPDSFTELCDEREAARRLGLSVATLRRRRRLQQPPVWVKLGFRVLYRKQDLEFFIDANLIHPSDGDRGNGK
jgi:hypothetical protein